MRNILKRKVGQILCEHEGRLVEAGLDEDEASDLVDDLECELAALEDEEPESETDEESEDEEDDQTEEKK